MDLQRGVYCCRHVVTEVVLACIDDVDGEAPSRYIEHRAVCAGARRKNKLLMKKKKSDLHIKRVYPAWHRQVLLAKADETECISTC